jgi:hypothetical protein
MSSVDIECIACVCHEANKAYCETLGDHSQHPWAQADEWQRESARNGVRYALAHPDAPPSTQHDAWRDDKIAEGWTYGPVKDAAAKTHPCMVSYAQLPKEQQRKDALFRAIVAALTS